MNPRKNNPFLGISAFLPLSIGLVIAGMSAQAANVTDIFTATGANASWSTPGNWSTGLPNSTNDVLFNAASTSTSTITATNFNIGSFNATRTETVTNQTATTTASILTLGGGSATTDQIPGSNPADLIYVTGNTLLNGGVTGALNIVLGQSGQFNAVGATLGIGTAGTASTLNLGGFTLTLTGPLASPNAAGISIGSVVSNGSIIKTGSNQAGLSAANLFTGTVTIEQGNLNPSNVTALGTGSSAIALGNANSISNNLSPFLLVSGNTTIARNFTVGASNAATNGFYTIGSGNGSSASQINGTITLNQNLYVTNAAATFTLAGSVTSGSTGTQTLIINNTGAQTDSAIIGGGVGTIALTKVGAGTATLSNAQTYTGATTVNQGTLTVTGSLASSSLALGGGTFAYAPTTTSSTQAFSSGTTINGGNSAITTANPANILNLGAISRSGNGTVSFTPTGTINTTSTGANGILGPYAYTGTAATLRYVTPTTIAAYTGTTVTAATLDTTGTANNEVSGGGTFIASASANTLRASGGVATYAGPVTLNGLMNAGTAALTLSGAVTIGANNELVVLANGQATNINGAIGDNGLNASALTYGGTGGTLTLGTINTYTGGTTVNSGTLALGTGGGTGVVRGTLTINTGATVTLTGNNALGFNAGLSVTTVNVNGGTINNTFAGNPLTSNQGFLTSFNLTGGTMTSTNAATGGSYNFDVSAGTPPTITSNASTVVSTISAPIVIRNNGNLTFNVASGVIGQDPRTASDLTVSGTILKDNVTTTNVGGISKTGAGILTLSGANTYTGGTTLNAGTLTVGTGGTLGATTSALAVNNPNTGPGTNVLLNLATAADTTVGSLSGTIAIPSGGTNTATISISPTRTFTVNQTAAGTYAGVIAGPGNFTLGSLSTNTLTLTGVSTYTGATTVSAGTLLVNGSLGNTAVAVNGSRLGGTGTIGGSVTVNSGGTLAPGASIATLATGTLSFASGSTFAYEMDSSTLPGVVSGDLQIVSGNLGLDSVGLNTVNLTLTDLAGSPAAFDLNTVLSLINYSGNWDGGLFTVNGTELADGDSFTSGLNTWAIDYNSATGGSNFSGEYIGGNFVNLTAIPEPSSAALLGGLGALLLLRRRRA